MSVRELREMRDRLSGFAGWGKSPMTAFGKGLASLAMPAYGLARLGAYGMSKAIQSEIDKRPPGYAGAVSGRTGFEGSPEMGGRRGGGRSGERGGGGKSERDLDRESRAATGERTSQRGGMGGL